MKKVADIGVGGCLLKVLANYLDGLRESRQCLLQDDGNYQWCSLRSLLCPLQFFIFVNDLPAVVKFGNLFLFADDFNFLAHGNLEADSIWPRTSCTMGGESKMELTSNKCSHLGIKGRITRFQPAGGPLESSNWVTDLAVVVNKSVTWFKHSGTRFNKTNKVLLYLRQILSSNVKEKVKMCLYQSLLLPSMTYGAQFIHVPRLDLQKIESFQKRVLKWITNSFKLNYQDLLFQVDLLPLFMNPQVKNLLFFHVYWNRNHICAPF